jgi:hypothetical protein
MNCNEKPGAMGVHLHMLEFFAQEARRRPFGGRLLTLGRVDCVFTEEQLRQRAAAFRLPLAPAPDVPPLSHKPESAARGWISETLFFRALGFDAVESLDVSDYERCEHVFDLNQPQVPAALEGRFDAVLDAGTLEHCFHTPNALNNVFSMLRTDGRVIHMAPSSNHVDHGFYMFSPALFWDYYEINEFEINAFQLFRYTLPWETSPWFYMHYVPGCLDELHMGGLDGAMYGLAVVATKTSASTGDRVPLQGFYRRRWPRDPQIARPAIPELFNRALARLKEGDVGSAAVIGETATVEFPDDHRAWLLHGTIQRVQGSQAAALRAVERSLALCETPEALAEKQRLLDDDGRGQ